MTSLEAESEPRYLRQLGAVVWKDFLIELRTRERALAMASFVILVGVLFNYGLDRSVVRPEDVAAGLVWMTIIFSGLLGVGRTFQLEAEDGAFSGVLMSPIPKDALFLGKVTSNFLLVLLTTLLLLATFALFFNLDFGGRPGLTAAVVALGALGFVALTTLFAALSSSTAMGETLLPVLVFPLLLPMIFFGSTATGRIMAGRPFPEVAGNVRILGAFTLIALLAGAVLFRYVVEE
jgi:heme exporter protein B